MNLGMCTDCGNVQRLLFGDKVTLEKQCFSSKCEGEEKQFVNFREAQ